jgi:hypothetical protein
MTRTRLPLLLTALTLAWPPQAGAQGGAGAAEPPAQAQAQPTVADDPDLDLNASQPDFTIVALPTTLRMPRFKSAFRVTHRFTRPLGAGDFGDLASDLFGLDSGSQIGLEYRFGVLPGVQVGLHRTNDRTIEIFGHYAAWQQRDGPPLSLSVVVSVDGTNNFRDTYSTALGVVLSREIGRRGAVYLEPIWVNNADALPGQPPGDDDTLLVGVGARIRLRSTVYLVGEISPRAGFDPGANHGSIGIEKRAGGHTFQLNFSNGFGTTMGQIARGGTSGDDWYLGFNISRKFF